jgi:hypothetical protein
MNIVVAIKQVPDVQQVRIRNREPILDGVPYAIGNIDKNALELGAQLKEKNDSSLMVLSAGNEEIEETVKEALAAGADEAYLVIDDSLEGTESAKIAGVLAAAIRKIDDVGVLLFGEGSSDNYSGQVSSRVAEILGLPQVGYACQVEVEGQTARITRQLEDGEEVLEVQLPIIRTFAPFVAGIGLMHYPRFLFYNVVGCVAWVALFIAGGYAFGNIPAVQRNFTLVVFGIIFVSFLPPFITFLRERKQTISNGADG